MKKGVFYLILVFFVWSCGSSNNEQPKEIKEEVFNPIEVYNTFIADNSVGVKEFKDNIEYCKQAIKSSDYQINVLDSASEPLIIDFLAPFHEGDQNAVFLRYELIDTLTKVKITYRGGDYDYTEAVNFVCGDIDSSKISKMDKFSLEYLIEENVNWMLKVRYIFIVENVEYEEYIVEDAGTFTGGYVKENIYVFDRQKNKIHDVFNFEYRVPEEMSYSVVEGEDAKLALASVIYERFQGGISSSIVYSFKDNNIIIADYNTGDYKSNQFLFNYR